jgi:hypothetical protein
MIPFCCWHNCDASAWNDIRFVSLVSVYVVNWYLVWCGIIKVHRIVIIASILYLGQRLHKDISRDIRQNCAACLGRGLNLL